MPAEVAVVGMRYPKFLLDIAPDALWGWMPVRDDWGVGWADLSVADDAAYNASAGVRLLTANLANTLGGGAVAVLQSELDARELPSAWVNTSLTWGQTIKRVLAFVMCIQRFFGETRQSLNVGRPKTTPVASLAESVRARLDAVASTLQLPAVDAGDTIETMMQRWADVLVTWRIVLSGVEL